MAQMRTLMQWKTSVRLSGGHLINTIQALPSGAKEAAEKDLIAGPTRKRLAGAKAHTHFAALRHE
jgi:hypothetical protein